ncbi:signal peptidase I [Chitinophaga lutea]
MNLAFWRKKDGQPKKKKSALREWLDAAIFAVIAATLIRTFIFEAYTIPTPSMEKTLLVNDFLFVSKVSYGPRIPMTPLAVPFTHHTLPLTKSTKAYSEAIQWKYRRMPGFGDIKRNDVVVFNFPEGDTVALEEQNRSYYEVVRNSTGGRDAVWQHYTIATRPVDKRENYIKRCVGLPGDSLAVVEGVVKVNGVFETPPPDGERIYEVQTDDNQELNPMRLEDIGVGPDARGRGGYNLTPSEAAAIKQLEVVHGRVTPRIEPPNSDVWPQDPAHFNFSIDNFGPIYIPKKGASVQLSPATIALYRRIIGVYEGNDLKETPDGRFIINGKQTDQYTFKMDYYWMMGDNRHNSADSRYWGFVPEDHVVGKAWLIWMSYGKGGIRWSRLFRTIR